MKPRHLLFLLPAIFAFATEARSQALWQGTTYGMSVADVQKVLPNAQPMNDKREKLGDGAQGLLRIDDVEVAFQHLTAKFYFQAGKLEQVTLALKYPGPYASAMRAFDALKERLRAKYGREVGDQSAANSIQQQRVAQWVSGHTSITIYAGAVEGFDALLNVNYQVRAANQGKKRAAHEADKL